ncbi:MAG: aminodeoxychorismate synthase, component I [Omnitrophica WOR_2 bacterium RIFCSPHIGHO2_02_FULL_52_10]|nr:MAG: aminodeoxychorismate synthase, component I [Omnitrophica WOR_2 bacterium RIFCSPHIGHO2_02_FULL_52_10]
MPVMPSDKNYISKSLPYSGNGFELLQLLRREPHVFFLDSSQTDFCRGRYSFIGFDPFAVFTRKGPDTLRLLKEQFQSCIYDSPAGYNAAFTPLTAGLVGCLSYDHGLHFEKIRLRAADDLHLPEGHFGFYDRIITIDHFEQKLHVTSTGLPERNGAVREARAMRRLEEVLDKIGPLLGGLKQDDEFLEGDEDAPFLPDCNFHKGQYMSAVRKALDYIRRGDIYQVNLSQRFRYCLPDNGPDPVLLYKMLRDISPAPFGAYMDCGGFQLISNSPERFLRLNGRSVQTRPMKGTRPRGKDAQEDQRMREELLNSVKEQAELLMITDLLRNDLGKVCDYGSVRVTERRTLEEYPYVFQATSTIEGTLRGDKDCFDLIRACFPGGSVTGCPKIRAMEIIEELEPTRRGMYTGSLGYINFGGNMDFNILIRTVLAFGDRMYIQVGGGIVADSVPEEEYAETLVKAEAIKRCLQACLGRTAPGAKVLR